MPSTLKIRKQIRSVANIKKITKAMELVSAAKMQKAVSAVLASRPFSQLAWQLVLAIASKTNPRLHKLLAPKTKINRIGILLFSSNRGLCGVFNQQIVRHALTYLKNQSTAAAATQFEFITVGKKGAQLVASHNAQIIADFAKSDIITDINAIRPISKLILDQYLNKHFDQVVLIYTDFISSLKQQPQIKQILPIVTARPVDLGEVGRQSEKTPVSTPENRWNYKYIFEPSAAIVLDNFLPRLIELQIYQAILESNASEHSARMFAMRNAADAATDLISDLTLSFNKIRQSSITQEISEITISKVALEG